MIDSPPNLGWCEQFAPLSGVNPLLNRNAETRFFGQVAVDSFTSQIIDIPTHLGGDLGKLCFLLGLELYCHGLRLGGSETSVKLGGFRSETRGQSHA